ncbi:MAG: FecR domain-containing protein [Sandaracinus sp.]|nr:FecR domain-containing protein [Sandaracinus sp.]MCB9615379.1 FecR domain-containing protein [Sandaracinus sp.]MCB9634951.1 FecR domain-containing protein [Sandaracinus sp.]
MTQHERLDRRAFVAPPDDPRRDDDNWMAIEARLTPAPSKRRWVAPVGLVAVAAAALLTFAWWEHDRVPAWSGTTLVAGGTTAAVSLGDGSEITAAPGSRLERLETAATGRGDEMRIALHDGSATFEVARNPARTFVVEAADVEVRVVGTRFVVRRELGGVVEVRVERGAVDVVAGDQVRRLRPGQSWRGTAPEAPEAADPTEPATEEPTVDARRRPRPRVRPVERPSPREAFDAAREARRSGDAREAATLYQRFLDEHPRDERAGLAAFELGRVRMDALRDARGAISAFARSIELAPSSPFVEDARARLVTAHARAGDAPGCRTAYARYLARHPSGRHVETLRDACP